MEDAYAYVDDQSERFLQDLVRLCHQPSISAQKVGLTEMAALTATVMGEYGLPARLLPNGDGAPVVYGFREGRSTRTLLFYNHYDVQPPEPLEPWESPPFEPTVRDGKLYARGVADNKANLLSRLAALQALLSTGRELPVSVKFVVEGEEEIGSPNLPQFVVDHRELLRADACIWESGGVNWQGQPNITLGLKGILYVEMEARGAVRDVHSSMATTVPNPAWRLVWALSSLKDRDENVLIPGFYDYVAPPSPRELEAVQAMPAEEEETRENLGLPRFLLGLSGFELRCRQLFAPTCTICGIWSGYTGEGGKTVLPSVARAKVDFRLVPHMTPEDVLEKLRRHLTDKGFSDVTVVAREHGEYPARTPLDHPFVTVVQAAARQVYGVEPVISPTMSGSGPMYPFTKVLGLPVASAGTSYPDSRAHAPNENIRLEDFVRGTKHIIAIMERMKDAPPWS